MNFKVATEHIVVFNNGKKPVKVAEFTYHRMLKNEKSHQEVAEFINLQVILNGKAIQKA